MGAHTLVCVFAGTVMIKKNAAIPAALSAGATLTSSGRFERWTKLDRQLNMREPPSRFVGWAGANRVLKGERNQPPEEADTGLAIGDQAER
jgi:hypothetical protein